MNAADVRDSRLGSWRRGRPDRATSAAKTRVARKFIVVEYDIPRGCCATYFPEANVLVPLGSTADVSNTPTSKFVAVTVADIAE